MLFEGLVFGFSLAADLSSLQLTIELFLAGSQTKYLQQKYQTILTVLSVFVIIIGFVLRFIRYGFQYSVEIDEIKNDVYIFALHSHIRDPMV